MFFSSYILTKKGPLAKVWLAAHWEKRLTKNEIQLIDLDETVVHILKPSVPISCRTHGELLLGCVRIYANKVGLLLKESTEATLLLSKKTKAAVSGIAVELAEAPVAVKEAAVTLPVGLEELVTMPELETFDVAEIFSTKGAPRGMDAFIPDDWFQPESSQFKEASTLNFSQEQWEGLKGSKTPPEKASERSSTTAKSTEGPRARAPMVSDDIIGMPAVDDTEFMRWLQEGPPSGEPFAGRPTTSTTPGAPDAMAVDESTAGVPTPAPVIPAAEEPAAKRRKMYKAMDPETMLSGETMKKNQKTARDLTRPFVPAPLTEHDLRCRQDQTLPVSMLMLKCPSMGLSEIPIGNGDMAVDIGATDGHGKGSLFAECVTAALTKSTELGGQGSVTTGEPVGGMTPGLTTPGTELPPPGFDEFQPLPMLETPEVTRTVHPTETVDQVASAQETLNSLKKMMKGKTSVGFSSLTKDANRRQAAAKFMDLLVLGSKGHVRLAQEKPYAEITVAKGASFNRSVELSQTTQEMASPSQSSAVMSRSQSV